MERIKAFLTTHRTFLIVLSLAVLVRLFFMPFPPFKTDMDSFIAWGEQVRKVGFAQFYNSGIWTDYAPGYFYILWLITQIKYLFFSSATREVYELLHKSVAIILDLATGVILYLTLRKASTRSSFGGYIAILISGLYLFSPFTFFNSAVWGQIDSVFTFFLALSLYFISLKRTYVAFALYVAGCVIKPQAVIIAPAYLLLLISHFSVRRYVITVIVSIATFYILTMPFFGLNSLSRLYSVLSSSIDTYPYGSLNTFNLWGTFGFWQKDTDKYIFGLTHQVFGTVLFFTVAVSSFIFFAWSVYRRKYEVTICSFAFYAAYLVLAGIMFLTRMHERYLYPFFFFTLAGFGFFLLLKYKKTEQWTKIFSDWQVLIFILLYAILTIIHLVNIYYVYVYYQYFGVGVPRENTFFYSVEGALTDWSYAQLFFALVYFALVPYYVLRLRRLTHE